VTSVVFRSAKHAIPTPPASFLLANRIARIRRVHGKCLFLGTRILTIAAVSKPIVLSPIQSAGLPLSSFSFFPFSFITCDVIDSCAPVFP